MEIPLFLMILEKRERGAERTFSLSAISFNGLESDGRLLFLGAVICRTATSGAGEKTSTPVDKLLKEHGQCTNCAFSKCVYIMD